jgi:hypothetical protein
MATNGPMGPKQARYILAEFNIDPFLFLDLDVSQQRACVSQLCGRDMKGLYWRENFMRAATIMADEQKQKKQ